MTRHADQLAPAPNELEPEITFRGFDFSDRDYETRRLINMSRFPEEESTVEEYRAWDRTLTEAMAWELWFAEIEGTPQGLCSIVRATWSHYPDAHHIWMETLPEHSGAAVERAILAHAIGRVRARGAGRMICTARSDDPHRVTAMRDAGAAIVMRQLCTAVNLLGFDPASFEPVLARQARRGLRITSVAELAAEGFDWKPAVYDFQCETLPDVPMPGGMKVEPYEEFLRWVEDPVLYHPDSCFAALDGERIVGMSSVKPNLAMPDEYMTGLTSIRRAYRRGGLATALKARALAWAKDKGGARVKTDNEENNPMYLLNRKLGFEDVYAYFLFEMPMSAA